MDNFYVDKPTILNNGKKVHHWVEVGRIRIAIFKPLNKFQKYMYRVCFNATVKDGEQ